MRPPATMGVECVSVPSCAVHFTFLPVFGSKESGKCFSSDTMLRDQACPHCGWSAADTWKFPAPTTRLPPSHQLQIPNRPRKRRRLHKRSNRLQRGEIQVLFIGNNSTENSNGRRSTRNLSGYAGGTLSVSMTLRVLPASCRQTDRRKALPARCRQRFGGCRPSFSRSGPSEGGTLYRWHETERSRVEHSRFGMETPH